MFDGPKVTSRFLAHSTPQSEIERWLNESLVEVADADVVRWWKARRADYPRLSRMALDYLTIPGTHYICLFFIIIILVPNDFYIPSQVPLSMLSVFSVAAVSFFHIPATGCQQRRHELCCVLDHGALRVLSVTRMFELSLPLQMCLTVRKSQL